MPAFFYAGRSPSEQPERGLKERFGYAFAQQNEVPKETERSKDRDREQGK